MISRLFSILFTALLALNVQAQRANDKPHFSQSEFQTKLEQFITKTACLTPKESAKFFPVYREMMQKQRTLHDELRQYKHIKPVSDRDCKRYVERMDKIEIEMKQIQRRYHEKYLQMFPATKVYDIIKAEDLFYRQMFKQVADKKQRR